MSIKIVIIIVLAIFFLSYGLAIQAEPAGPTNLRVQVCAAESSANNPNTFGDACDGTYPAACPTDLLSCNDGSIETHSFNKNKYGGVRIQDYNTTINDCGGITQVHICYERWVSGGTLSDCLVAVDADGGSSYTTVTSTCPGAIANPGLTCTNITTLETWTCANFFNTTGTRAFAKLENSRSDGGPGDTLSIDAFFFNVTYTLETNPPEIKLLAPTPSNGSFVNVSNPIINFSIIDLGSNVDSCIIQFDHANFTMSKNGTGKNIYCNYTTSSLSEGSHNFTIYANDSLNNLGNNGTFVFTVDTVFPKISFGTGTQDNQANLSTNFIYINVSVTELNENTIVFNLRNSSALVNTTSFTDSRRLINFSGLNDDTYFYNVSINDSAGNLNYTLSRTLRLDNRAPNVSIPNSPISGGNYSRTFLINVSILDVILSVDSVIFNITNSSGVQNATFLGSQIGTSGYWNATINTSHFPQGTYNISIIANDSLNIVNKTESVHTLIFDNTPPRFVLNYPTNDSISQNKSWAINTTITDNLLTTTLRIYGGNDSLFDKNNSLIFKKEGVSNSSSVNYNWTAPVLSLNPYTRLLMHFDLEGKDNSTLVYDESGFNNGTKLGIGSPSWNVSGKLGYSLQFDGVNDRVKIIDSNYLDLNQSFSIGFWAYPKNITKNQTFLSKGSGTTANYFVDFKTTDDNKIEFGFYNGAFRTITVNASTVQVNKWIHVAVTLNDTSNISRVYINGIDKGSLQLDFDVLANNHNLTLGSYYGYTQNYSGLMDEIVIYNKTLSSTEIVDIYQLKDGDWYWRVNLNDTASNMNISETRVFTIGKIWEFLPASLGTVSSALDVNLSLGTITINNTHPSKNVTINITSNYASGLIYFNETLPLNLTNTRIGNSSIKVQINASSATSDGSTTISFNITATDANVGGDSIPASDTVESILVATQSQPFLISKFETVPIVVSQNNTGVNLKASVVNLGQGDSQNVRVVFKLPNGWSNSSGLLNQSLGALSVGRQKNASITVNINSTATSGIVTLYANITGQNDTGFDINASYKTVGSANVTVNAISGGTGPTVVSSPSPTSALSGSGGGGGSGGSTGGVESTAFKSVLEIVRGSSGVEFNVYVSPLIPGTILKDITLRLNTKIPLQYISIIPNTLNEIKYGEKKSFKVKITAPSYAPSEVHEIKALLTGKLIGPGYVKSYRETQDITLIVQEIPKNDAIEKFDEAKMAIEEMRKLGYNTKDIEKLLEKVQNELDVLDYAEVKRISEDILSIYDKARETDIFLRKLIEVWLRPDQRELLLGSAIEPFDSRFAGIPLREMLRMVGSESTLLENKELEELLTLAIFAFEEGKYDIAQERAKTVRESMLLEIKTNPKIFFRLYWHLMLIALLVFVGFLLLGIRRYQIFALSRKIDGANNEEKNVNDLILLAQQAYFSGKISGAIYKDRLYHHQKFLAKIKKRRIKLRNKRVRRLKPVQLRKDLKLESMEIIGAIKSLQKDYYVKKKIPEASYKLMFEGLNERMAEIENERATLDIMKYHKTGRRKRRIK